MMVSHPSDKCIAISSNVLMLADFLHAISFPSMFDLEIIKFMQIPNGRLIFSALQFESRLNYSVIELI